MPEKFTVLIFSKINLSLEYSSCHKIFVTDKDSFSNYVLVADITWRGISHRSVTHTHTPLFTALTPALTVFI